MDERARYEEYLKKAADDQEFLCHRCGACCGLDEKDPCKKLIREPDGKTRCADYENRFGIQETVNGNKFKCVPVRRIIFGSWAGAWKCGYKKTIKNH